MNDLELQWLIPTMMQVTGIALALGVLGFVYEAAVRENRGFIAALERGANTRWLAGAGGLFSLGLLFTRAGWLSKGIAITLTLLLIVLAWVPQHKEEYRSKVARQKLSTKSVLKLAATVCLAMFVVLILVWTVNLGWHAYHLYGLAGHLPTMQNQTDVKEVMPMIEGAASDIRVIYTGLKPLFPIFGVLDSLPRIGPYLGQVEPLLTYTDGIAQAGMEIVTGIEPLLDGSPNADDQLTMPERISQVLEAGQENFVSASQSIDRAAEVRSQIRSELLPGQFRLLFVELDKRFDLLVAGGQLLKVAPGLLGNEKAQNYLVLAQNRDELRASGGFISGIGLVTVKGGKILQFTLGDSYAIDDFSKPYPSPPEALKRFMLADYWVTRDANWSPDFPTAAQEAQALYTLSIGIETQGVIAFNQLAVQKVLEVIGPVEVPGTDEPVTAENVENYMRQAWAPEAAEGLSQEWWLHRKDFMQLLGNVILDKILTSSDEVKLLALGKAAIGMLEQGQLLVYFTDASAQAALDMGGLNGELRPGEGDYLYLVDSNVGFNKVDSVITRSLTYHVDLSDLEHPTGKVTLNYQHTGIGNNPCIQTASYGSGTYQDMQQRCYWDYWRVYTPAGSELLSSTAQPVAATELLNKSGWAGQVESQAGEAGTQVLAGMMVLPISKSMQFDISYTLPATILRRAGINELEYTLSIDKQPGLQGLPFRIEIVLPPAYQIVSSNVGWETDSTDNRIWQGVLEKSTTISLILTQK